MTPNPAFSYCVLNLMSRQGHNPPLSLRNKIYVMDWSGGLLNRTTSAPKSVLH